MCIIATHDSLNKTIRADKPRELAPDELALCSLSIPADDAEPIDPTDFDAVSRRYYSFLYAVAARRLRSNWHDGAYGAEDFVQIGLMNAFRAIGKFDPRRCCLRAFLTIHVTRAIFNERRSVRTRLARERAHAIDAADRVRRTRTEEDPKGRNDDFANFWTHVRGLLSPRQREVITLRYIECRNAREAGEILGVDRGCIKSYTSQAMKRLRAAGVDILKVLGRDE